MDIEEDDPMEIDDNLPAAPIIERKSDEFMITPEKEKENHSEKVNNEELEKKSEIIVLDDDDDIPNVTQSRFFIYFKKLK